MQPMGFGSCPPEIRIQFYERRFEPRLLCLLICTLATMLAIHWKSFPRQILVICYIGDAVTVKRQPLMDINDSRTVLDSLRTFPRGEVVATPVSSDQTWRFG